MTNPTVAYVATIYVAQSKGRAPSGHTRLYNFALMPKQCLVYSLVYHLRPNLWQNVRYH